MKPPPIPIAPCYRRVWFWVVVLGAVPVVAFVIWRIHLAVVVSAKLDRVKAAGYPINGKELNAFYPAVPPEKNAALAMADAFELLWQYPDSRSNEVNYVELPRTGALDVTNLELLKPLVLSNAPAMARARQALELPECRYPVDYAAGPGALLPHLSQVREMARQFRYKARLDADAGQIAPALESISSIVGLGRTLESEPELISHLVLLSLNATAHSELEHALSCGQPGDGDLARLAAELTKASTNRLATALVGERALYLPIFRLSTRDAKMLGNQEDKVVLGQPLEDSSGSPWGAAAQSGILERELPFYLDCMETNIAVAKGPLSQMLASTNLINLQGERAKSRLYIMSSMVLPGLSRAFVRELSAQARWQTAQSAIAVERFRLARGRLPSGLEEVVPQYMASVPLDPFDGKPVRFQRLDKGYAVYSVGPDGVDDGGKEPVPQAKRNRRPANAAQETSDITFIVER